jgi:predicted transcriptional regulator
MANYVRTDYPRGQLVQFNVKVPRGLKTAMAELAQKNRRPIAGEAREALYAYLARELVRDHEEERISVT